MKNIYIGYSDLTNTLYAFTKKDYSDKQDVSEQFANTVRKVCKLNNTTEIKIDDLVLQIKETKKTTKEELVKEAEEWLCNNLHSASEEDFIKAMIDIAEPRDKRIEELEVQNRQLQCCANCRFSYGGEEEPYHDCGYCHAMQCICKLKLEEHTSDIYREWENKCDKWEMRVN